MSVKYNTGNIVNGVLIIAMYIITWVVDLSLLLCEVCKYLLVLYT